MRRALASFPGIVEYLWKVPEIAEIIGFVIKILVGKSLTRFPRIAKYIRKASEIPGTIGFQFRFD